MGNPSLAVQIILAAVAFCFMHEQATSPALAQPAREISVEESNALLDQINRLQAAGRYSQAIPPSRRYAEAMKARHGQDSQQYAVALHNLAYLLRNANHLAEAEPVQRGSLAIYQKVMGPDHPTVAAALNNLASLLQHMNRLAEAEPLYRRVLAIHERRQGSAHPDVAIVLSNLAGLLRAMNRLAEAEPLMRRALVLDEKNLGANHAGTASSLNNLAQLLTATGRYAEAEPLYRRALAIFEKRLGPEHPNVAIALNNVAHVLQATNRLQDAEPLMRRALALAERRMGRNHPDVATALGNLASLLASTRRLDEAEAMMRRALVIDESGFGPTHPKVALRLSSLATLLHDTDRTAEGEPLLRRALTIDEKGLGPGHPDVAADLNNLALMRASLGDWAEARQLYRRSVPIMIDAHGKGADGRTDAALAKAALNRNSWNLRLAARATFRADRASSAAREEGFALAQWALQTGAADALAQMAVRFARGDGALAGVLRERQDLVAQRRLQDQSLLSAVGKADARAVESIRTAIGRLDARLTAIDRRLATEFPDYAEFASAGPLTIAAVQGLLRPDEALVLFLDVLRLGKVPEETLAWVVTRERARWISVPIGSEGIIWRVGTLRCGLDRDGNWSWSETRRRWEASHHLCRGLAPEGLAEGEPLPFDLQIAHELYVQLLAPLTDLTADKRLIIVPTGSLTNLPFHVLVEGPPPGAGPLPASGSNQAGRNGPTTWEDYQGVQWLALKHPVSVLPSVASLRALRKLQASQAGEPYIGFGNPLLDGDGKDANHQRWAKAARAKQSCGPGREPPGELAAVEERAPGRGAAMRGGISLAAVRAQPPLPDTADELCAVATALGARARESETLWLGERATEGRVKSLSRSGALARYRVLHFATHGLLAGESESILNAKAEPALLLTPPHDGATPRQLEEDDGVLTASEVAQLHLDADWVVLSACNTAAGDKDNAEALSGLARAFFYARARALLVAHWYVDSAAAVKLTAGAFEALGADHRIGRAESLRRSMTRLINAGGRGAHPSYWAPFVLVGDDGRQGVP